MVQRTGVDANDQTTQTVDHSGDQNRVTAQARDQAFGPRQRPLAPGDHAGPDKVSHYHVDTQGRVDSLTNSSGETTQLKYADGSSQVQSYRVVDSSGAVMEQATRDKQGGFNVDGTHYKDVKVGRLNQLQLIDDKGIAHERLLGGNSIRVDERMPRTSDGNRPVQAEVSPGGRANYEWSAGRNSDGSSQSNMDNYTIRDSNNNITESGIRAPNGHFLTYRPRPGESGINKDDLNAAKKLMKENPDLYRSAGLVLGHEANPGDPEPNPKDVAAVDALKASNPALYDSLASMHKRLDNDQLDTPTSVSVDNDGNRIEQFANGEITHNTSSGVIDHVHLNGRHSRTIRGADQRPHLTYTESTDPQTGEKRTEQFQYDQNSGVLNKYTETKHAVDQYGEKHDETHTYTKNGDQWVDESGRPSKFTVVDNRNGSVSIVDGDTMHNYNDDGSELFKKQHKGHWLTERELTSSGGETKIKYDGNGSPKDVEYCWPGSNGTRPIVEHLQRFQDPNLPGPNGEYWQDTSVRGGPPHYWHATVDKEGTIHYSQNGRVIRQDDPRDQPRTQDTTPQKVQYRGAPRIGYSNSAQSVWNPTGDRTISNDQQVEDLSR